MYQARGFQLNLEPSQGARTHTLWQIWDAAVCTVISVFFNKIFPTQILTHTHTHTPPKIESVEHGTSPTNYYCGGRITRQHVIKFVQFQLWRMHGVLQRY